MMLLDIKTNLSTAFQQETDGQTERVNQVLEQYLRIFATTKDWDEKLPLAEFEYNNAHHSATKFSPFFATYGFDPRSIWPNEDKQVRNPASEMYEHYLRETHAQLSRNLHQAQDRMRNQQNKQPMKNGKPIGNPRHGKKHPDFEIGQEVLLDTRNMNRGKLDERKAGPFKISWVGRSACTLEGIPPQYHPTFHVSLLEPYQRGPDAPPPVNLPPLHDGQDHYEPEKILAHGEDDDGKTIFLVSWKRYPIDEATWEPYDNLIPGAEEILHRYYLKHPKLEKDPRFQYTPPPTGNTRKRRNEDPDEVVRRSSRRKKS